MADDAGADHERGRAQSVAGNFGAVDSEGAAMIDRRTFLGGSDIGAMLGVSPYTTPYELWEEKTAPEPKLEGSDPEREKYFRRGKKLEPMVIEMLQEERDVWVTARNQRYERSDYPWMAAEIDFEYDYELAPDTKPLTGNGDVKTVHPFAAGEWGAEGTDEFPVHYCAQFQWGMWVTGRSRCMVAALIGADDLRVYEVRRDEELIAEVKRRAIDFWENHVLARVPPPPQTTDDAHKMLSKYAGFSCEASPEISEAIRRLNGVKAAKKRLDATEGTLQMEIRRAMLLAATSQGILPNEEPKKYTILNGNGKPAATLSLQERGAYQVKETSFWVLRTSK
jgi:putative phage-type endonuclease